MTSISEKCQNVEATFAVLQAGFAESDQSATMIRDKIIDQQARFFLLHGNAQSICGFTSALSVEARSRDTNDVLQLIAGVLDTLQRVLDILCNLNDLKDMGSGLDVEPRTSDDTASLAMTIEECITHLFRGFRLIQTPKRRDELALALLRLHDRATGEHYDAKYDVAHVGQKYPKLSWPENAWLKHRLGSAITKRRQVLSQIKYRLDSLELPQALDGGRKKRKRTTLSSEPSAEQLDVSASAAAATPKTLEQAKSPTRDEDEVSYSTVTRSENANDDAALLDRIPELDELQDSGMTDFECPFCFRMVHFTDWKTWRKHVFADLRCYVCTFPDCDAPFFSDINEWFSHELETHRVQYQCMVCHINSIQTRSQYLDHLQSQHPVMLKATSEEELLKFAAQPITRIAMSDCPCCTDWGKTVHQQHRTADELVSATTFKRHLGSHLEQLALFALPAAGTDVVRVHEAEQGTIGEVVSFAKSKAGPTNEAAHQAFMKPRKTELMSSMPPVLGNTSVSTPYIFRIDELRDYKDARVLNTNKWMPTIPSVRVSGGVSGRYWYCNGSSVLHVLQPPSDMAMYSVHSAFYKTGHGFWIYSGDAAVHQDSEEWQTWQPLRFDHVKDSSYLSNAAEYGNAKNARSDQPWARMLLPDIYHDASTSRPHTGMLIGELGIFLALIAFSMQPELMNSLLPQMMAQGKWQVHTGVDGRDEKRGVVVYVYTSSSWYASAEGINSIENGATGGYYR